MFRFAFKNMLVKRTRMALVAISIIVSACVGLLAYNVSCQINDGIVNTAGYYDLIIGPAGSQTQLAMNTMFFTDKPLGTIDYSYIDELMQSGLVNEAVPFTMGDSYNSSRIVGTTSALLSDKELKSGEMFEGVYEAVVGSEVAEKYSLKVGDKLITSHGLSSTGTEHAASPLTVTGILKTTHTNYDNTVFTSYKTVWAIHSGEDHEEEDEDEEEAEAHDGEVCAILVRTKGFNQYYKIMDTYGEDANLLVINPATVLREVLDQVDTSSTIVYILCGVILVMNLLVISVITLLNLFDSKKEIALMRMIGISMRKIGLVYLIQNGLLGICSTILALLLSHLSLGMISSFTASMGIVLNSYKLYPMEIAIAALVFVISVLPTMVSIFKMAGKDVIEK